MKKLILALCLMTANLLATTITWDRLESVDMRQMEGESPKWGIVGEGYFQNGECLMLWFVLSSDGNSVKPEYGYGFGSEPMTLTYGGAEIYRRDGLNGALETGTGIPAWEGVAYMVFETVAYTDTDPVPAYGYVGLKVDGTTILVEDGDAWLTAGTPLRSPTPIQPIPEPNVLGLLCIGAALLLRRKLWATPTEG